MNSIRSFLLPLGGALLVACGTGEDPTASGSPAESESDVTAASSCTSLALESVTSGARAFLFAEGLGKPSDEKDFFPGLRSAWAPLRAVEASSSGGAPACLLVMNLAFETKEGNGVTVSPSDTYEVIAFDPAAKTFQRFEQAVFVPEVLHVAYGQPYVLDSQGQRPADDFYYVELTREQALDTWKAVKAEIEYSGFSAHISAMNVRTENHKLYGEPDGKVAFDPTPRRTWKVKSPAYSLRRGSSAEILDVYPGQLDGDFLGYFSGSNGQVAPWDSGVRRWKLPADARWNDTKLPDKRIGGPGVGL